MSEVVRSRVDFIQKWVKSNVNIKGIIDPDDNF